MQLLHQRLSPYATLGVLADQDVKDMLQHDPYDDESKNVDIF